MFYKLYKTCSNFFQTCTPLYNTLHNFTHWCTLVYKHVHQSTILYDTEKQEKRKLTQPYTTLHNFTQHAKSNLKHLTKLYTTFTHNNFTTTLRKKKHTLQHYTKPQLHKTFPNWTKYNCTHFTNILQTSTQLLHNLTTQNLLQDLYTTFTRLHTTSQDFTQLHNTLHNFTNLHKTVQTCKTTIQQNLTKL